MNNHNHSASKYPYNALNSEREFRLITLEAGTESDPLKCTLVHNEIGNTAYEALSYEWGDPTAEEATIYINDQAVNIRVNLFHALKQIRKQERSGQARTIWIDALCIDQSNFRERNHQVQLMGRIYSTASNVIVWLGLAADDSDKAMSLLEKIHTERGRIFHIENKSYQYSDEAYLALYHLCTRSYWTRIWVVQEYHLAKSITILCGDKSVSGDALEFFDELLCAELTTRTFCNNESINEFLKGTIALSVHVRRRDNMFCVVADWLRDIIHYKLMCSEPRDVFYSLLGISADLKEENAAPVYERPVIQVFVDALEHCNELAMPLSRELDMEFLCNLAQLMDLEWEDDDVLLAWVFERASKRLIRCLENMLVTARNLIYNRWTQQDDEQDSIISTTDESSDDEAI